MSEVVSSITLKKLNGTSIFAKKRVTYLFCGDPIVFISSINLKHFNGFVSTFKQSFYWQKINIQDRIKEKIKGEISRVMLNNTVKNSKLIISWRLSQSDKLFIPGVCANSSVVIIIFRETFTVGLDQQHFIEKINDISTPIRYSSSYFIKYQIFSWGEDMDDILLLHYLHQQLKLTKFVQSYEHQKSDSPDFIEHRLVS